MHTHAPHTRTTHTHIHALTQTHLHARMHARSQTHIQGHIRIRESKLQIRVAVCSDIRTKHDLTLFVSHTIYLRLSISLNL